MQHLLCRQQHAEVFVFLGPEQGWKELPSALRAGDHSAQPLLPQHSTRRWLRAAVGKAAPNEQPPTMGATGSSCSLLLEASEACKAPLQALVGLAKEKTPFTSVCSGLGPAEPLPPGTQLRRSSGKCHVPKLGNKQGESWKSTTRFQSHILCWGRKVIVFQRVEDWEMVASLIFCSTLSWHGQAGGCESETQLSGQQTSNNISKPAHQKEITHQQSWFYSLGSCTRARQNNPNTHSEDEALPGP